MRFPLRFKFLSYCVLDPLRKVPGSRSQEEERNRNKISKVPCNSSISYWTENYPRCLIVFRWHQEFSIIRYGNGCYRNYGHRSLIFILQFVFWDEDETHIMTRNSCLQLIFNLQAYDLLPHTLFMEGHKRSVGVLSLRLSGHVLANRRLVITNLKHAPHGEKDSYTLASSSQQCCYTHEKQNSKVGSESGITSCTLKRKREKGNQEPVAVVICFPVFLLISPPDGPEDEESVKEKRKLRTLVPNWFHISSSFQNSQRHTGSWEFKETSFIRGSPLWSLFWKYFVIL